MTDVLAYVINQILKSAAKETKETVAFLRNKASPLKKYETKNGTEKASQMAKKAGSVQVPRT